MGELRDNAEKAAEVKGGSSVRNRALELIGTELGMFRNDGPRKPITLEDLSTEDLERMLKPTDGADPGDNTQLQ